MRRILTVEEATGALGAGHDALPIARKLQQQGIEVVSLVLQNSESDSTQRQANQYEIDWPSRFSWSAWQEIRAQVRRVQPDEIHVWGTPNGLVARVLANLVRCPVKRILTSAAQEISGPSRRWTTVALPRRPQNVVRHRRLAEHPNANRAGLMRAAVLPWFKYANPAGPDNHREVRQQLNIPPDATLAGTVAHLTPQTRIKDFLWASDLLRCVRDDVYWLVLGQGPHLWRLKRYASQLDLGDRLRFLNCSHQTIDFVAALDIYVQPSDWFDDYGGLRMAISCGIPAIGNSRTIHDELITHHKTGFLVEKGARNEIARCVNRLVNEPEVHSRMKENIRLQRDTVLVSLDDATKQWLSPGPSALARQAG